MRFRDSSISWKLTLFAVVTTLISVATVITAVSLINRHLSRLSMIENYLILADVVGQNCAAAVQTDDEAAAQEALQSLHKDTLVAGAGLYNVGGKLCATLPTNSVTFPVLETAKRRNATITSDGYLHVIRPVYQGKTTVGYLYLQVSVDRLSSCWWDQMAVAAFMFVMSLVISVALAARMQRVISGPVVHLVEAAQRVTKNKDFTIRATRETGDELGELVDRFNEMLAAIQVRDEAIEVHQQNLELLVLQRTVELERKTKEATAASVAKSAFLANMSHEIRTPMNAIIGFANLLRKGDWDSEEERIEFLNTICSSGEHLLALINDILDLSKIEAGCMTTENIPVSPHQLMADVVSITRVNAITKGLVLDYAWNGPVPRLVMTDPAKLRQLLINLIGNAIKFTERGGVHLIASMSDDLHNMKVQVIDSGIGIPAEKLDTIFKPFSQADASTTRRFGGTGLGLSISRKIAEALGGSLTVESELGTGTTFTATLATGDVSQLELSDTPPVADLIPNTDLEAEGKHRMIPRGCRVLLVEDGDTNRRLIHKMLERHGIEVHDAENGQIGVDLATTHEYDLILMDMQMPVKDGYTAATELRAKGLTIPIVALTAHAMSGDSEKCRKAGCSDYLTKPIREARLLAKVADLLNRPKNDLVETEFRHNVSTPILKTTKNASMTTETSSDHHEVNNSVQEPLELQCSLPLDDEIFFEIVHEFSEKLFVQIEKMKLAYAAEDWPQLAELAHWLKGSGGTAGYEQFTIPSTRLERLAQQKSHDKTTIAIQEIERLAKGVAAGLALVPVPSA